VATIYPNYQLSIPRDSLGKLSYFPEALKYSGKLNCEGAGSSSDNQIELPVCIFQPVETVQLSPRCLSSKVGQIQVFN
jgi:hypothetical protein